MHGLRFARIAFVVGMGLAAPRALPAQAQGNTFLGVSVGVATKSDYGLSESQGIAIGMAFGRVVSRHTVLRLDAEVERFGVKARESIFTPPCLSPQVVCTTLARDLGDGPIGTVALLASAEWYERPDRRGFYLLGGFGPQVLATHPDRPRSLHLAVQGGAGLAIPLGPAALLVEARYLRALGGGAEPPHLLPVTASLRFGLGRGSGTSRITPGT